MRASARRARQPNQTSSPSSIPPRGRSQLSKPRLTAGPCPCPASTRTSPGARRAARAVSSVEPSSTTMTSTSSTSRCRATAARVAGSVVWALRAGTITLTAGTRRLSRQLAFPEMSGADMRRFWDERARENPLYYVDNKLLFQAPDQDQFWHQGERELDAMLDAVGARVG